MTEKGAKVDGGYRARRQQKNVRFSIAREERASSSVRLSRLSDSAGSADLSRDSASRPYLRIALPRAPGMNLDQVRRQVRPPPRHLPTSVQGSTIVLQTCDKLLAGAQRDFAELPLLLQNRTPTVSRLHAVAT